MYPILWPPSMPMVSPETPPESSRTTTMPLPPTLLGEATVRVVRASALTQATTASGRREKRSLTCRRDSAEITAWK